MNSPRNVESALGFLAESPCRSLWKPPGPGVLEILSCVSRAFVSDERKGMCAHQIKQQLCFYCQVKILCGIKQKGKRGLAFFFF